MLAMLLYPSDNVVKLLKPADLLTYNQTELPRFFKEAKGIFVKENMIKKTIIDSFTYDNIVKNRVLINVLQEQKQR